jgi:hypothetical protein
MTEKAAKSKTKTGDGEVEVVVFVPRGQVREGDIRKGALLAARDQIPVAAYNVALAIGDVSDVKTKDGEEGRDYTVKISFTPRKTTDPEGSEEQVTVDKVLASLDPLTPEKLAEVTGTEQGA